MRAPGGPSTAIMLFTDVVGSTELRARLGEDAAEEARRLHDRLVCGAISAHRGRVVKNLGDGVMATFAGAADAVAAAVSIQRALDRRRRGTAITARFEVRIGLSAGDVTVEDEDCFGTPVVEAARLCAVARGGQILATEVVRLLAGPRAGQRFVSCGTLDLKGLPDRVPATEIGWAPESGAGVPLPRPLDRPPTFRFVGRKAERQRLVSAWREAAEGDRRVVLIGGEPGVGKSRLVTELARAVHDQGAVVIYGRCDAELGLPYQPFAEGLRAYVEACPVADLRLQLGPLGGELVRLVPSLPDRAPGLAEPLRGEPETERYRLLEAVAELLGAVSDTAPTLLVLDDLHWAGKPTLVLLRHLVRTGAFARLMLVGTYRDTELFRSHPVAELLADLRREPGVERLTLRGLVEAEVTAFVEASAGHPLDTEGQAFASAVHAETAGNPFFVGELLRHLTETGAVVRRAGRWTTTGPLAGLGIPDGVREVVGRRLSTLPEHANGVLSVAAVIGREFDAGLLTAASEAGERLVLDTLEAAEQARLIASVPGRSHWFAFSHALVRSTLYEELTSTRRLRLHRRIGQALEARPDADAWVADLARHFGAASALGEAERAVIYARRAGERAQADLAFEEAAEHYEHALSALDAWEAADQGIRCDLQTALGDVLHHAGDPHHRAVLLAAASSASSTGDARRLAAVVVALNPKGVPSALGKVDEEVVGLAEEALRRLDPADSALRARLLAVLAVELTFTANHNRRAQLIGEAVEVARRVGERSALARVLASCHWCARGPDSVDEVLAWAGELVSLGDELGEPEAAFWGHLCRHDDLLEAGDLDGAAADLHAAETLAGRLRQPLSAWRVAIRRTGDALLAGRLADVETLAAGARELGREAAVDESFVDGIHGAHLFLLRLEQARLGETEETLVALARTQPQLALWQAWLGVVHEGTGRQAQARLRLESLTADGLTGIPRDLFWLPVMVALGSVASSLHDGDRCQLIHAALAGYAGRIVSHGPFSCGPVDLTLGILAGALERFDEADRHLAACIALCERIQAPLWLAHARRERERLHMRPR